MHVFFLCNIYSHSKLTNDWWNPFMTTNFGHYTQVAIVEGLLCTQTVHYRDQTWVPLLTSTNGVVSMPSVFNFMQESKLPNSSRKFTGGCLLYSWPDFTYYFRPFPIISWLSAIIIIILYFLSFCFAVSGKRKPPAIPFLLWVFTACSERVLSAFAQEKIRARY